MAVHNTQHNTKHNTSGGESETTSTCLHVVVVITAAVTVTKSQFMTASTHEKQAPWAHARMHMCTCVQTHAVDPVKELAELPEVCGGVVNGHARGEAGEAAQWVWTRPEHRLQRRPWRCGGMGHAHTHKRTRTHVFASQCAQSHGEKTDQQTETSRDRGRDKRSASLSLSLSLSASKVASSPPCSGLL